MIEDLPLLFDRIRELLDRQRQIESAAPHADVEHTLTDGYAGALALEGERERTRKRISALAREAQSVEHALELQTLMSELQRTEIELAELRGLLRSLAATR